MQIAINEYAPVCDSYETWIMTLPEDTGFILRPKRRDVTLVIRARGIRESTSKKLYNLLKRGQRHKPEMVEIRCSILLEIGDANGEKEDERQLRDPKRYRTIPRNTLDRCWLEPDLRWSTIRRWIDTCGTEHDCIRERNPELPSRYLDIGIADSDPVKIVISNGDSGGYACLSHCWGGKSACTLNENTKHEFLKEIPRRILPPVFLDAIMVCRKLGLRRLWIDSLCIQQDKKEDWEYESTRMGKYYSNCTICIAATSSANSMESFKIADRPTVVRSPGTDPETGPFNLLAYPSNLTEERPHFGHAHDPETLRQSFPLLTRAWVLQERWLSPRVLHFCGSEVVFECAQTTTCECGQARLSLHDKEKDGIHFGNLRGTTTSQEGLIVRRHQLAALPWTHIVTTYSALNLTYNTDRLLAVSGVASTVCEMQHKSSQEDEAGGIPLYLAGIWRIDLTEAMAWFTGPTLIQVNERKNLSEAVATGIIRKSKPAGYLAPSWSWASVLDPVRYLDMSNPEPMFTLLNAHINLATTNRFGSVKEGCYLHLRGKILETSWDLRTSVDENSVFRLTDITGTQQLNKPDERGIAFSPDYSITKPGRHQIHPATKLYVFPLATIRILFSRWIGGGEKFFDKARSTICLVLKKCEGDYDKGEVFERVGFTEYASLRGKGRGERRNVDTNVYREKEVYLV